MTVELRVADPARVSDGQTGDVADVLPSNIASHTPPLILTDAVIGSRGCDPAALSPSLTSQPAGERARLMTLHGAGDVSLGSPGQPWKTGGGERRDERESDLPGTARTRQDSRQTIIIILIL